MISCTWRERNSTRVTVTMLVTPITHGWRLSHAVTMTTIMLSHIPSMRYCTTWLWLLHYTFRKRTPMFSLICLLEKLTSFNEHENLRQCSRGNDNSAYLKISTVVNPIAATTLFRLLLVENIFGILLLIYIFIYLRLIYL